MPLAISDASFARYTRARSGDSFVAKREAKLDLGVDYLQSDEIMLLVIAAVVEEKAIAYFGRKTEAQVKTMTLWISIF